MRGFNRALASAVIFAGLAVVTCIPGEKVTAAEDAALVHDDEPGMISTLTTLVGARMKLAVFRDDGKTSRPFTIDRSAVKLRLTGTSGAILRLRPLQTSMMRSTVLPLEKTFPDHVTDSVILWFDLECSLSTGLYDPKVSIGNSAHDLGGHALDVERDAGEKIYSPNRDEADVRSLRGRMPTSRYTPTRAFK